MSESNTAGRKHSFVSKHPVLASVLLALLGLTIVQSGSQAAKIPFSGAAGSFDWIIALIGLAIAAALVLLVYKWWFRPEFSGMLPGDVKAGFLLLLPILAYWIIGKGYDFLFEQNLVALHMSGQIIETSFIAGVAEELAFRGLMICTMLRLWRKDNKFVKAAVVSAALFGLIHAFNIVGGADVVRSAFQVFSAGFLGFFFAAVFIRCGSILPVMAAHTLHDIIALGTVSDVAESGLITGGLTFSTILDLILCAGLCLAGIRMLRKEKTEEIRQVWDRKWKDAGDVQ